VAALLAFQAENGSAIPETQDGRESEHEVRDEGGKSRAAPARKFGEANTTVACASPHRHPSRVSTITEIEAAMAQLAPAQWMEVRRWVDLHEPRAVTNGSVFRSASNDAPDFLARQKELFGGRVLPDSQAVLDEVRAERF
jgi:hypothetical protein